MLGVNIGGRRFKQGKIEFIGYLMEGSLRIELVMGCEQWIVMSGVYQPGLCVHVCYLIY